MREIMRDNECNSETSKQKKTGLRNVAPRVRPEEGHLAPEVKTASELICDHVWDKLYPPFL
jgi:hypothetical protein